MRRLRRCHQLIRDGATLAADASHILDDLGELPFDENTKTTLTEIVPSPPPEEAAVFSAVAAADEPVDRIIERSGLPAEVVTANHMKLELRRLVRAFPGFRYVRR